MQKQALKVNPAHCAALAALLALAACGGDQPARPPAAAPPPEVSGPPDAGTFPVLQAAVPPGAILLDGLYATSSAPGHDVTALFDDDPATGWRTRTGAGPDEGIMLYFSPASARRVKSIETKALAGSAFGPEASIQIYVNGQPASDGAPGARITIQSEDGGDVKVNSLFLRFAETGRETATERPVGEEDQLKIGAFPAEGFVGLQSLRLLDDKGETLQLVPPERRPGRVAASSALAPETAYGPANLFDARKEFGWVEGNAATAGEGETLTFTFAQPVRITALKIWNGYQRSPEHYAANARAKNFSFGAQDGPTGNFTLRDDRAGQKIDLPAAASGQVFTLKINSVFPGKKYKDLALSDILFYDGERPFVLASEQAAEQQTALRARTAASPLAALLDRRVYNRINRPFGATVQSLILRSDGTFVLYNEEESYGDESGSFETTAQTIADGNWELLETAGAAAKVKVFGKWFDYTEVIEWYKGPSNSQATKIFSDVLTIDGARIVGEKMIGTFYRN